MNTGGSAPMISLDNPGKPDPFIISFGPNESFFCPTELPISPNVYHPDRAASIIIRVFGL